MPRPDKSEDALISAVKAGDREAMVLKHGLLLANDEAAKVLGISREALWTRLSRARQELRKRWHGRV